MKVAFVGGTGPAGLGLAARFAMRGIPIVCGSRKMERAEAARDFVLGKVPGADVGAELNPEAVTDAEVVFPTVPPDVLRVTCEGLAKELAGKIVVSMSNPVKVEKGRVWQEDPPAGSLAEEIAEAVPDARVVGAFREIHVKKLPKIEKPIIGDTIVTGDDPEAKKVVFDLVRLVEGLRPIDGGGLINSRYVEGFVTVLVQINFNYKASTHLKIEGLPIE